jgi:hypothetical protein
LFTHVLEIQILDGLPVETEFAGNVEEGGCSATPSDIEGEAFGVKGVVGKPTQFLLLHGTAPRTVKAAKLDLQVDACVATREVADAAAFAVIEGA